MHPVIENRLKSLDQFISDNKLAIFSQKEIQHGHCITVTDGSARVPVNLYQTGKIVVQGKVSSLRERLQAWKAEVESGGVVIQDPALGEPSDRKNKYIVIPKRLEFIRERLTTFPYGDVTTLEPKGAAELYRIEVRRDRDRISITQYQSGTLLVQGRNSVLFDDISDYLDLYLKQSFSDRAARYLPEEVRATQTVYLEGEEAENEAVRWLSEQLSSELRGFLSENDQQTLISAAGVRNAIQRTDQNLPDYAVIVMPFAKAFEGFMIQLAIHIGLVQQEAIQERANEITIGQWLRNIRERLPDTKRYGDIYSVLDAAWSSRNKCVHSDPKRPNALHSFAEAEQEIAIILRAMSRAHRDFVQDALQLIGGGTAKPDSDLSMAQSPNKPEKGHFQNVDREKLRARLVSDGYNLSESSGYAWAFNNLPALTVMAPRRTEGLIVVKGEQLNQFCTTYNAFLEDQTSTLLSKRIGVDESGKGDYFGPLVVAGVALDEEGVQALRTAGVRDSKTLSNERIKLLAEVIRQHSEVELLILRPLEYNRAYDEQGRNLNRLLAWCHARVIQTLGERTGAGTALSDQFGKESLLIEALDCVGCTITLEQRYGAEEDIAVAAASIVARAAFVAEMHEYSVKTGIDIPLGASDQRIPEVGRTIYRKWGEDGLARIAKLHFKTTQEIVVGGNL